MTRSLLYRLLAITFLVLPCLFVNGPNASAQRNKEIPVRELLSIPGKLVSEAKSSRPTTELKLTGYRVEEIKLPRQLNVELRGNKSLWIKPGESHCKVVHSRFALCRP